MPGRLLDSIRVEVIRPFPACRVSGLISLTATFRRRSAEDGRTPVLF